MKCCARHSDDFHRPTLDFAESIFSHVANQRLAHSSAVERSQINVLQSNSEESGDRCDRFVPRASLIQDAVHAWFAWLGRPLLSHSVVLRRPQKTEGHCSASWTGYGAFARTQPQKKVSRKCLTHKAPKSPPKRAKVG
jgi:hypothetical protein